MEQDDQSHCIKEQQRPERLNQRGISGYFCWEISALVVLRRLKLKIRYYWTSHVLLLGLPR